MGESVGNLDKSFLLFEDIFDEFSSSNATNLNKDKVAENLFFLKCIFEPCKMYRAGPLMIAIILKTVTIYDCNHKFKMDHI